MDISEIAPGERVIDILHPVTGEEIGLKITLVSLEDEKLKRLKRKFLDEKIRLESRGKTMKAEDTEEYDILMIYTAITGWVWEGDSNYKNEKPEFNLKNVRMLMTDIKVYWIRKQILEALEDEAGFF